MITQHNLILAFIVLFIFFLFSKSMDARVRHQHWTKRLRAWRWIADDVRDTHYRASGFPVPGKRG